MIVIVGAGPAGMAAAIRARECGAPVTAIDDNATAGGQIWRGGRGSSWLERFAKCGAKVLTGTRAIAANTGTLRLEKGSSALEISYSKLILATGARELFLPFPGWTLPNVLGVGGMQALVKSGLAVAGKRIVVAGSGPLLLAVAHYLRERGATIPVVAEQAPWGALIPFSASLTAGKLLQAAQYSTAAYRPNTWVTRAMGRTKLEQVQLNDGRTIRCDYLANAYGFVPNSELARHMGCESFDAYQEANVAEIYSAGESTGIGGVDLSLVEGEIAGYAAAGRKDLARKLFPARKTAQEFAGALNRTFAPRGELRKLAEERTIVCRCEDVRYETLRQAGNWRAAKLHFRCGMGPCQGRICGPATEYLFGWPMESVRPPVFPARVSSLITKEEETV